MYVRLAKGVKDKGILVPKDSYKEHIDDENKDWYISSFTYNEDAKEYFDKNNDSIKGYNGKVWTDTLYWDLDSENNVELARYATVRLLQFLEKLQVLKATEVYFSGNKGYHVLLKSNNKFTPEETSRICSRIALESGLQSVGPNKTFDTTVYNTNRIFRVTNTRHQTSKLFKIPLTSEEVELYDVEEIKKLAINIREGEFTSEVVDVGSFKEKYKEEPAKVYNLRVVEVPDSLDLNKCPPSKRRCIFTLENGHFGYGERENACIRLAAYYRGQGLSKDHVKALLDVSLQKRKQIYDNLNIYSDSDTWRIVNTVFDEGWNGGTYSCASENEEFLRSKCSINGVPCSLETTIDKRNEDKKSHLLSIGDMVKDYTILGDEALKEYPKFGIDWLDEKIRIKPSCYSIINGSVGSGKTSFMIQTMENWNRQKIRHLFCSLDMSSNAIFEKMGAKHTKYTQAEIGAAFNAHSRNKFIMEKVIKLLSDKYPYTIFDFTSAANVDHIERSIITYNKDKAPEDCIKTIIIDYAGRIVGEMQTILANAVHNSNRINDIAKSRECPPCNRVFKWEGKTGTISELTVEEYNKAIDDYDKARVDTFPRDQRAPKLKSNGNFVGRGKCKKVIE
jgi:hypothetical protein